MGKNRGKVVKEDVVEEDDQFTHVLSLEDD